MAAKPLSQPLPSPKSAIGAATLKSIQQKVGVAFQSLQKSISVGGPAIHLTYRIRPAEGATFIVFVTPERVRMAASPKAKSKAQLSEIDAALAAARVWGEKRVAEILEDDDMKEADEFAAMLGISRQAVHDKRQKLQML